MTATSESLKAQGNAFFAKGDFEQAIEHFGNAIDLDKENHVLYSNRSAAYASLKKFPEALADAEKAVSLKPEWAKAYSRKGAALHGLGQLDEAREAYEAGLKVEPGNAQLQKALEELSASSNPLFQAFQGDIWSKLGSNPATMPYLAQPDYVAKMKEIQRDPNALNRHMQDPRIMQSLGVCLGINMQFSDPDKKTSEKMDTSSDEKAKDKVQFDAPQKETKSEKMETNSPTPAQEEKEAGNKAYKAKNFEVALAHYDKAWDLDSTDITFLTNKAAVLFEMGNYDECIAVCNDAVDKGRDMRVDYKLIARALGRIGNAYLKKDDLDNAIKFYQKSMAENRTPEFQAKLRDTEKLRDLRKQEALYDPAKAEELRNKGNEYFKQDKFAEAVKEYTAAIARAPKDPRAFSNRAACYTKLMALPSAIKDCDTCIALDASFIKAYTRKANVLFSMREYNRCIETCDSGLAKNPDQKSTNDLMEWKYKANMALCGTSAEERRKAAMNDPEVMSILQDPVMNQILQDMQRDPAAVREHMKNPEISRKLQTLSNAGFLEMR